jgi:hypothetical protein
MGGRRQALGPGGRAQRRTEHVALSSVPGHLPDLDSGQELASARLPSKTGGSAVYPRWFDSSSSGWLTCGPTGLLFWPTRHDAAQPEILRVGPPQQLAGASQELAGFSKDCRIIALPQRSQVLVLDRERPGRRVVIEPLYDVRICAVSPDGRWVVTCSWWWDGRSNSIRIWEAETGHHVADLPLQGQSWAAFSPDGRWLASFCAGSGCQLWEVGTWRPAKRFRDAGHFCWNTSPDSRLLALSDPLGFIRLVEPETGREVAKLTGPEPNQPGLFSPDGTRLIAEGPGHQALYIWDLRLIRKQLKALRLDWDWPELPPADGARKVGPSKIEILLGDLAKNAATQAQASRLAIDRYRSVIAKNPNDANACNALAWAYVTAAGALRDVTAAVPLAENAVRLDAGNVHYRNTLGVAYYRAGRYREAVDILRANLDKRDDKGLAFDLYFLAMSHHGLGETARARDYMTWAVRWMSVQRDLTATQIEELELFRAEAEELLGSKERP